MTATAGGGLWFWIDGLKPAAEFQNSLLKLFKHLAFVVCSNHVTRDGAWHLTEVLKKNPSLEIIHLSSNRIEDEGAVYLSEAIAWPGCSLRE